MSKVVVIGAGASGIIASLVASSFNEVVLLEGMDKCAKKILLTGNGKCNYWNEDINTGKYNTDDVSCLEQIISSTNQENVLSFLSSIGLYPKIKNGYYYPYSTSASSVREIFMKQLEKRNIKIISNFKVKDIKKEKDTFIISSEEKQIKADKIILATGSKAFSKTGSDGSGYILSSTFGHTIHPIYPALTSLISSKKYDWAGTRVDAKLELFIDDKKVQEELGEIQLTENGISGICTFNISSKVSKNLNKKITVKINFLPNLEESCYQFLTKRNEFIKNCTIEELLESIFPYKLMFVLLKEAGIKKDSYWNDLKEEEKNRFVNIVEQFPLEIIDTSSFDKAQVCTGGVSLTEINPLTMESKIVDNLYIVGELLDVDGICGGFNLAFAFITGYLAGKGVNNDKSKTN